ncbi:MAG: glucose-6-phosphate isomerase family protein [Symbiobacteriia bacterium]
MKDLSKVCGLPLTVDEKGVLHFGGGLPVVKPAIRLLADVRDVLAEPDAQGPEELYFMYRDMGFPAEKALWQPRRLRYDVTVIPPGLIGEEFNKTAGHYHPLVPGQKVAYPEVYEVIQGVAHYLLQRPSGNGLELDDVVLVEANPGDKVLIPPGYGHITINPGKEVLVMSNLVEATFGSVYEPFRQAQGGAYYEFLEEGEAVFEENEDYGDVPELRIVAVKPQPALGLTPDKPLYIAAKENPDLFAYLVRPQDFAGKLGE